MEFQIKISKYSKRGHGLGMIQKNLDGSPVFAEVVGTVIGDTVLVETGKKRKKVYSTILKEIILPSEDRVKSRCQYVGICGGCTWQQKQYKSQLKTKEKQIEILFKKKPLPIIPADQLWHYRNKMEYTFSQNKQGEKFLGLIIARSKGYALNLERCHLTSPWFIEVLGSIREWWKKSSLKAYHAYTDMGTLRTLTLREGKRLGNKMVFITISGNLNYIMNKTEIQGFKNAVLQALPGETPSIFLRIQKIAKKTPTTFYEMHLHGPDFIEEVLYVNERALKFKISPGSFFQIHPLQAERLYTHALELADPKKTDTVFDLYSGTGTLGIAFAPYVKKVISIELNPYAICDAELNVKENNLSNIFLQKGDVGTVLSHLNEAADIAVIDPPRSGLDPTAQKHLLRLSPKKILYISCNPWTQSQNIFDLKKQGYALKILQPIDQFPHTYHVENIAVLEKN